MERTKKNKFAYVLLVLVLLPLALLFGCGDTASFSVEAFYSGSGTISGSGTYTEGSTVTLTATAKSGSFLGWVRDDALLASGENGFTITNTSTEQTTTVDGVETTYEYVTKSVLTFTASSSTQGSYTAVFDDSKVMYVQLSSVEITSSSSSDELAGLSISDFTISEGSNALKTVLAVTDGVTSSSIASAIAENSSVLKLDSTNARYVQAFMYVSTPSTRVTLRAELLFQTSTEESPTTSGTYHVEYSNGTYNVVFTFAIGEVEYEMTLKYTTLSATTVSE